MEQPYCYFCTYFGVPPGKVTYTNSGTRSTGWEPLLYTIEDGELLFAWILNVKDYALRVM